MSARTRRSRSSSRIADAVYITAGDPKRLTGGNVYAAHMTEALRERGIALRTIILRRESGLREVREPLAIVDTVAGRFAVMGMRALRASGTRVILMALMSRGAIAMSMASDQVVAASDSLRLDLTRAGIDGAKIAVVPPGQDAVRPHDLPRSGLRVLCVANWTPDKRVDVLVRAIGRVPEVTLDLVGDAPDREYAARIRALARDPSIARRVRVWGSLGGAALEARYRAASIFALPSRTESYGMALATALAHGLPSIAGDIPASREVAGDAALLVGPRVGALTGALRQLANDADLRERLHRAALERARTFPSWRESESRFVAVIREQLGATTRTALAPRPASRSDGRRGCRR